MHRYYLSRIVLFFISLIRGSDGFICPAGSNIGSRSHNFMAWGTATDVSEMKVREIKDELKEMGIDFSDCFDKESLAKKLEQARNGEVSPAAQSPVTGDDEEAEPQETITTGSDSATEAKSERLDLNQDEILIELRGLRVKELRTELAERGLRWAGLLEKEDLVQAVLKARIDASNFSSTGLITPGKVAVLTGPQLTEELAMSSPMLLDVYATWCGPCQMMVPILEQAASDLKGIRFVKMDSDAFPEESSSLKVQGLPTLVLFNEGEEVDRVEGAMMKDQLKEWIQSKGV